MHAPSAGRLLQVWEDTRQTHPIQQALSLLAVAWPEVDSVAWSRLPIGKRDAHLLDIHEAWFGAELQTATDCESCGTRLEADFPASAVRLEPGATGSDTAPAPTLHHAGYEIEFRVPNSEDLLAVAEIDDTDEAQNLLLHRCVGRLRDAGTEHTPARLPAALRRRLDEQMARLDPGADLEIRLDCPVCGREQSALFDIVSYLCGEFDDWAQRTLADVHLLACAYGWSESEILALSPTRRQQYVAMVSA